QSSKNRVYSAGMCSSHRTAQMRWSALLFLTAVSFLVSPLGAQTTSPAPPTSAAPSAPGTSEAKQPATAGVAVPSTDDASTTFRVNVKLVNVFATVTDSGGAPVASLKQDDFQIFEDGIPQKIAMFSRESELPLSIVLAIDTSLSTKSDQKLELESARRFA